MKKTIKYFGFIAIVAMAIVGCAKEIDAPKEEAIEEPQEKVVETHTVTISAGSPETKTSIVEGVSSASFKWSSDDATRFHIFENEVEGTDIGLETSDEYVTVKLTATFETVSAASYKYTAFLAKNVSGNNPQIPSTQTCTGTAYDPNADILIAKPVINEGSVLAKLDMQFGRPCVINKMTLKGLTVGETLSSVEIYADKPLTGYYDIEGKTWTGESAKITLSSSQEVPEGGQVTVYFVTMPVESATLTVTAITDGHVYNKTFGSAINFVMDQVTVFGVSSLGKFKYRDVITQTLTGLATSGATESYNSWSNKNYPGVGHSSAVYAGNSCEYVSYLQIRGKSNSGIISTTSGGNIKRVFVAYCTSKNPQDGRKLKVLGKESAYSATSDLYNDSLKGDEIGTITFHTGDKINSLNAVSDYDYVALLADGAIYYDEIDIFWDDAKSDPGIKWTADGNSGDAVAAASATRKTGPDDMPAASLYNPNSLSVTYSSTDDTVAEINSTSGEITLKTAGVTTIKATFAGNATYKATVVSYSLTVTDSRTDCETPAFSPAAGSVAADTEITISSTTLGSTIYYTTDGTTPTTSSLHGTIGAASATVTIDVAKTLKAIAVKEDYFNSSIASASYTITGITSPLPDPTGVAITVLNSTTFTGSWTNDTNAADYEWIVSTSSTYAGIVHDGSEKNVIFEGNRSSAEYDLSGSTCTVTKSDLTLSGKYYFYVKAKGDGVYYSDSENTISKSGIVLSFALNSNPGGWPTTNSTTLTDYTYTLSGTNYTFKLYNIKCNSGYLMCTKTAGLGLPAISGYKLSSVIANNSGGCSTSVKVGISSTAPTTFTGVTGGADQTWSTTSSTYTYNLSSTSANTVYYLYVTTANAQIVKLTLTYLD